MAYIGNSPANIQRGRRSVYEFKATAGQTAFSGADLNNQTLDLLEENEMGVYLNGIRLADSDDYSISGDTLTLLSAASLNDQLTVETQTEVANISSYTRTETDARYINYDGDIINGTLQIAGSGNNVELGDNNKAVFGGGDDLQIYHNGSNSYVKDAGTGNLNIITNGGELALLTQGGLEYGVRIIQDGAVEIRHDDSTKLATTATGIDVTGTVTSDGLIIGGDGVVKGERGTASAPAYSFTDDADTGMFNISNANLGFSVSGTELMRIQSDGAVVIKPNGITTGLRLQGRSSDNNFYIQFKSNNGNSTHSAIGTESATNGLLYNSDIHRFNSTSSATEYMRIDASGNVVIGANSSTSLGAGDNTAYIGADGEIQIRRAAGTGRNMMKFRNGSNHVGSITTDADKVSLLSLSGDLTLDVAGDINLDADGGSINLKDGGALFGTLFKSSSNMILYSTISNGDMKFQGVDGGSNITALTLDMSDGGAAKFGAGGYNNTKGVTVFGSQGQIWVASENATGGYFNRKSSDGVVITLARDDSDKGFIGVRSSNVYFSQASKGIGISSARIYPTDGDGNFSNGAMDIGNSDSKFKDLYLSGGVYLGGTGSANKLDDLESGTWTPQDESGNDWSRPSPAKYYKIGDLVTCWFDISHNSNIGSNANKIGNFPFTSDSGSNYAGTHGYTTSNSAITFHLNPNSKLAAFYVGSSNTQMTGRLIGSITYRTA